MINYAGSCQVGESYIKIKKMPIDNSEYTLLIIVSLPEEAASISEMIKATRFNIMTASNHDEAIQISEKNVPDLILLDMDESAKKEFLVIRQLKKNKITQNIPVLFFTSVDNEIPIPVSLCYDNIDFITKPFRDTELITRIKHQLFLLEAQRTIRQQNKKLKKIIESRDRLYSVIAHDLRAPIGTIKMINTAIENKKNLIQDPEIRQLFEMVNKTTEEAFNLLENLLRWSRNQNGKTKVSATTFNIFDPARQVSSLFTTIANAKNISLNNHIPKDISVYADEDMIKAVLRNLISNAIKFSYPGGKIDIDMTECAETVTLSIKDNGQGINKEMQSKLLKNIEHVTSNGTQNERGSGLGLLLCKDFVKMNGGKLWFVSQAGEGSTFYFTLPQFVSTPRCKEESSRYI